MARVRGRKTSSYIGVKKRGECNAVEMRRLCPWISHPGLVRRRRFELTGFRTQKHAAVGHDLLRVLDEDRSRRLNFRQHLADFVWFAEQRGMEFKVDPKEEKGRWDGDKKRRFMELVEDLNQIISAEPARAEEIGVADSVQVNNGGTGQGSPFSLRVRVSPFSLRVSVFRFSFRVTRSRATSGASMKAFNNLMILSRTSVPENLSVLYILRLVMRSFRHSYLRKWRTSFD